MESFCDILARLGHTDKNTRHTYGPWYEKWFAPYRNKRVNILEVGVCVFGGGCVLALAEYFPKGQIWAADIDRSHCGAAVFKHPRIQFLEGDAYTPEFLAKLGKTKFDIIIDDASHEAVDQLKLLGMLRLFLKQDGFYVIEDVCPSHWRQRLHKAEELGLRAAVVDESDADVYDNCLIRFDPV